MPNGIRINGHFYTHEDLLGGGLPSGNASSFEKEVTFFYKEWYSPKNNFEVATSGSTGKPKKLRFSRDQLIFSARQTIETFGLQRGNNLLLCLSPRFIAGKMMIVRALVGEMNIEAVEPTENPLFACTQKIHFAAMVPQQLAAAVANPETQQHISKIDTIIVGGGIVGERLLNVLSPFTNNIYQTFGMTETLTHIAIKKINGPQPESSYTLLKGVAIDTDQRNCLKIKSPVNSQWIITNDIVEIIDDQHFKWLGRYDNIVNSGGIKISPEEIEEKISAFFREQDIANNFFLSGLPDEKWGEKLVLVIEGEVKHHEAKQLLTSMKNKLPLYKSPKDVILLPEFKYTTSGKVQRKETLNQIFKHGK